MPYTIIRKILYMNLLPSWILYAIISSIFAALVAIFGKMGLDGVNTTLATTIRATVMTIFLIILTFTFGKFDGIASIQSKPLLFIFLSGIAGALSWLFYFAALRNGTAAGVTAIDRLSIVIVFVFAIIFLGDHFTWKHMIGAIFAVFGAILLILK
jgi:bacterial/archaeal transporter family protein